MISKVVSRFDTTFKRGACVYFWRFTMEATTPSKFLPLLDSSQLQLPIIFDEQQMMC